MGQLVDGKWQAEPLTESQKNGAFRRAETTFRNWITLEADAPFPAQSGRYHLYVSLACPWAHRTLIFRALKELENHISVSVVDPLMLERGWKFPDQNGSSADTVLGKSYLHEVYAEAYAHYTGRASVPVLWDKENCTIVSNESSEIIRMFNSAFNEITGNKDDYYPEYLRGRIDEINARVYSTLNNGVYKSGFARTQKAYEDAVFPLFDTLDWLEEILAENRYVTGGEITEADWRLFPTLLRFDSVYFGHFKCNIKRLVDYPNLWGFTRELYQWPGVGPTINLPHIKQHYYASHETINPTRIVPAGPDIDFSEPHGRGD
ncbi:MAG: glutathione S-transferase family protein [Hyphomicrobiales bacterium]